MDGFTSVKVSKTSKRFLSFSFLYFFFFHSSCLSSYSSTFNCSPCFRALFVLFPHPLILLLLLFSSINFLFLLLLHPLARILFLLFLLLQNRTLRIRPILAIEVC